MIRYTEVVEVKRMQKMMWQFVLTVLMLCLAIYLHQFLVVERQDMDMVSYLIGRSLPLLIKEPFPKNTTADISLWRRRLEDMRKQSDAMDSIIVKEDITFLDPSNTSHFIRIYRNNNNTQSTNLQKQVVIWLHGGGWVLGSVNGDDAICQQLLLHSKKDIMVVSVEYRLAPEHPFPVPLQDVLITWHWVVENIAKYGGDHDNIILAGESSGGNLAAAAAVAVHTTAFETFAQEQCQMMIRSLQGLLLVYPPLDPIGFRNSFINEGKASFLTATQMEWFHDLYSQNNSSARQSAIYAPNLASNEILQLFPKTVIVLAKHDVLLDEGLFFANQLQSVQVDVRLRVFNRSCHGFFGNPQLPEGKEALIWSINEV